MKTKRARMIPVHPFRLLKPLLWAVWFVLPAFRAHPGVVFTNLYSFVGTNSGAGPYAGLVQGSGGCLYGTTFSGGITGHGTVFKINTNGALTSLHSFTGTNDGSSPEAGLVEGSDGYFYGTTTTGGTKNRGTVFKIDPNDSQLTSLYSFAGGTNGMNPEAALVQGSDGYFYGTAASDGESEFAPSGGTVFKISTNGAWINLGTFTGSRGTNGVDPQAGLVQGSDGCFYGTTVYGGRSELPPQPGYGTVFKVSTNGALTCLYSFTARTNNGSNPYAGLALGNDGYLYGTTAYGGDMGGGWAFGDGTVFKISATGVLVGSYSFAGTNGANPWGKLLLASDGYFYGTTYRGGTNNLGTVFRISTNGELTNLHSFTGTDDGAYPYAGLAQGSDGRLYGTTCSGGGGGNGTIFRLTVEPEPPELTITTLGTNVILVWPTNATDFTLQSAPKVGSPTVWSPSATTPVIVNGQHLVTNAITGTQQFFRLRH